VIGKHQKSDQSMTILFHFRSKWCVNFPLSAGKFYFQENLWESSRAVTVTTITQILQYQTCLPSKQKINTSLSNDIFVLATLNKHKHTKSKSWYFWCKYKTELFKYNEYNNQSFLNKLSLFQSSLPPWNCAFFNSTRFFTDVKKIKGPIMKVCKQNFSAISRFCITAKKDQ
jgi:hypothetical protein